MFGLKTEKLFIPSASGRGYDTYEASQDEIDKLLVCGYYDNKEFKISPRMAFLRSKLNQIQEKPKELAMACSKKKGRGRPTKK